MDKPPIPSYVKPPVTEVAAGVTLAPLAMQTRHIGQFWTEIRDEYPVTEDAPPVPIEIGQPVPELKLFSVPPLRRAFLITQNREYIMQIQEGKFLHNWRRFPADAVYPRYPAVLQRFRDAWEKYAHFLLRADLGVPQVTGYELTYVNELGGPNKEQVSELIKPLDWNQLGPKFLVQPPQLMNISWSFSLPDGKGSMNVSINRGPNPGGGGSALLVLSCQGPSSANYSLNDWFDTAREWIVNGFTDLTTKTAHKVWERDA